MNKLKVYLDNCCLNRPYDRQDNLKVRLETEAKLFIQGKIKDDELSLVWSFMLSYENSKNPFELRREQIGVWKNIALLYVGPENDIRKLLSQIKNEYAISGPDAVHLACAIFNQCDVFLTTDYDIIKKMKNMKTPLVLSPVEFISYMEENP